MTDAKLTIFVVDDDPLARLVIVDALGDPHYVVCEFAGGAELLAAAGDAPDIVLLDVEMPGMSGVDACHALLDAGNDHAVVLFVSAHDDLETRLAAYQAGGSDFIVKPCQPEELIEKVRVAEHFLAQRQDISQQAQFAQQAAFTAMSSMGEMGAVLQFFRRSYACHTPEQLAEAVFEALAQYGLDGLLGMHMAAGDRDFSSRGACSPLEHSILAHAGGMERIFQLRDRVAVNYPKATLLAVDLPLADPDRVGRIRDHLAILMEGADARIEEMEREALRIAQNRGISRATTDLTQALADIEKMQAGSRVQAMEIGSEYLRHLTNAFVNMGLSEDQEAALAGMAQDAYARLEALHDEGRFVGDLLRETTDHLRRLTIESPQSE